MNLVLTPPPAGTEPVQVPIIEADISSEKDLPNGIAGILVPKDTEPREGYVILQYSHGSIKQTSVAVASACVGDDTRSSLDKEILQIYNVAPQKQLVEILLRIYPKTRYRVHIIVFF
jgi:hypothetical protein